MLKKLKLAPKLALTIGSVLTVILVILITITISLSKAAISTATYGELMAISKYNSMQIQSILDEAETVVADMQSYLQRAYDSAKTADKAQVTVPTDPAAIALCQSQIYNAVLNPITYDIELYLRETARTGAISSQDIVGIGVMFEPYKFQSNIRDYSFYASETIGDGKIPSLGTYQSYSALDDYQLAMTSKIPSVTSPYEYNGDQIVSYASPIVYNNEIWGVISADIRIRNFDRIDTTSETYPSMYATIFDSSGLVIYDSDPTAGSGQTLADFTPDTEELSAMLSMMKQSEAFQIETTREDGRKVTRFFTPLKAADKTWWSLTAVETEDIDESIVVTTFWMVALAALALVLIIFTIILLLRRVLGPVDGIVSAARDIAAGKLNVQLQVSSEDEIGVLSRTFMEMTQTLNRIVTDMKYILEEMASGNFAIKTRAEESYVGEFEGVLLSIRKMNRRLSSALSQINASADQVTAGSEQMSSGAQALSQGATEQAASVEELAATVAAILDQVQQTAQNAAEARDKSNEAGEETQVCNEQMKSMISAMDEIGKKSSEIGKIIKTIEDIAFQTNILALNAAVEAARAGAAGKGFAVVADEVRNLASKSAEASKNTSTLIQGAVTAVEKGTQIANDTAESLVKVVESTQTVSGIVDRIAEAAAEQSASIGQVNLGMEQISSVVQTNSATAEESAASSEELSSQAQILKGLVGQFKLRETNGVQDSYAPRAQEVRMDPVMMADDKY